MISVVSPPEPDLLTLADRRAAGHDLRHAVPRTAHADWTPRPDRPDPVALLQAQEAAFLPALLPLRHARMMPDPFAFLRGGLAVMAADLGTLPSPGLRVQTCGDAHLGNFGAFADPGGDPVFDVNDFDETLPAPFEWDLKRLAVSLAVLGRVRGLPDKPLRTLARRATHAYRRHMHDLAGVAPIDAWGSRLDVEEVIEEIGDRALRRTERQRLHNAVAASRDTYLHLIAPDGRLHMPARPEIVVRLDREAPVAEAAFASWRDSLAEERRLLVERYRLRDVAFKAAGVGSVGQFSAIGLFATADGDRLLLQAKEARPALLAPFAGASAYPHQGQRVVVGQRLMQATGDLFLGWGQESPEGRQFYVRQLKDSRLAAVGTSLEAAALPFVARLCGRVLARAHARSGDAARLAGYMGDGDAFDTAISTFALAYARQVEADHAAFVQAIHDGRLAAAEDRRPAGRAREKRP